MAWLIPPHSPLAALISRLNAPSAPLPILVADKGGWTIRPSTPFTGLLQAVGLPGRTISQDPAITERAPETHLAERPRSR
ncbi:hypothetical protein [Streptomyces sp. SAI-127]|uniref:hypothetical protein n=1 Tax=Streptomyces sp. SAI-127 TaxID=2940543 RepID=UPI0024743D76|nr:hypothetical protein [Streptomyces sp. SAI-127]MDH6484439.1 hypothetical protein [Streptomyces sp. SAI-127]